MDNLPVWLKHWTLRECCHMEKLDYPGGWRWRCDGYHPEVIEQYERWLAEQARQRQEEEEDFWRHE